MNEFDDWWDGYTGLSLNSERCASDLLLNKSLRFDPVELEHWMRRCWNAALQTVLDTWEEEEDLFINVKKLKA